MKIFFFFLLLLFIMSGCAPKMGEDILIEPQGNIHIQNTGGEILLGVLSLLGAPVEKEPIRLGGDLKVTNKWRSDFKLVSLSYTLNEGNQVIAEGGSDSHYSISVASGQEKIIPIMLRVDPEHLSMSQISGILNAKRTVLIKGEAVIEIWGIRKHYVFEKEATKLIQKALKKI